jgi:hypothetical protein
MIGWELIAEMVASFLGDGLKVEALTKPLGKYRDSPPSNFTH